VKQILKQHVADAYARITSLRAGRAVEYWEHRYSNGGLSGDGSTGRLAKFKAEVLNGLVAEFDVTRVLELGCGDGQQLVLATYPEYVGIDISPTAVRLSTAAHASKSTVSFLCMDPTAVIDNLGLLRSDMAMSLDVIYHILDEDDFNAHVDLLFESASKLVVLFASDSETLDPKFTARAHIRHWPVRRLVDERFGAEWQLARSIPNRYPFDPADGANTSIAHFQVYTKIEAKQ